MNYFITSYFLLLNLASFILMAQDKKRAERKEWRISESNLLFLCFAGGFIGTFLAMKYIRHKTKHWYFGASVIVSALFWVGLFVVFVLFPDILQAV